MKIQTAGISTGVVEVSLPVVGRQLVAQPVVGEDRLARHLGQNARTWSVLERLGVREGTELALAFSFEGRGAGADRALAEHLRRDLGYSAEVDADGVSGSTTPMPVSPRALDDWVTSMLRLGAFGGWTATVRR